jgi:citrate lyase subunit beta/citryl-CoA lyase
MKKLEARENAVKFLSSPLRKNRQIAVRVNCPKTSIWGTDDIQQIFKSQPPDALIIPKVEDQSVVELLKKLRQDLKAPEIPIWCMIETPKGVQNVDTIAQVDGVEALVFGLNDMTKELKAKHTPSREPLLYSMSRCIIAARAAGKQVIDGVHLDLNDEPGLIRSCIQGRELGFDGKSLIHPNQITATNAHFSPTAAELELAYKFVKAYETARAEGKAIAVVDNKMVEELHVIQAQQLIEDHKRIQELEEFLAKSQS